VDAHLKTFNARWVAWTPVRREACAVLLRTGLLGQQGYPFCLDANAEYRVHAGRDQVNRRLRRLERLADIGERNVNNGQI
jgi:hypothetical protein